MTAAQPDPQPTTRARVREIFASGGFRRLFATRAVSQVGDGIFQLATADLLLFDKPGPNPALTLTLLSVVTLVPFSIISPFVGVFIDRWERRKILEIVPVVRAALALMIGLGVGRGTQGIAFYVIVLAVLSANRLFLATMSAVLPQVVPQHDLLVANSVASTGGSISNVLGLGIGAGLAALIGGTQAAGVAAVAFVAGAFLARRLDVHRGTQPVKAKVAQEVREVMREMADGVRKLRRSRRASYALSAVSVNQALIGALTAATAVYFIKDLGLGVGAITVLLGVLSVGLAVGVAIVPLIARRMRHDRLIPLSFAVAAISVLFAGATLSRVTVIAAAAVAGLAYAMTKIPVDTIVQEEMPDSHRGRAFAAYDMLFNVARVAGTAACAVAIEASAGSRGVVVVVGVAWAGASVLYFARERRMERAEAAERDVNPETAEPATSILPAPPAGPGPQVDPETLFPAGEMITVRTYAGHRADVEPRVLVVGGREIPVDAVDWRAVEERTDGERRSVFVVRAAGVRIRLTSSEESSRWEVAGVLPSNETA